MKHLRIIFIVLLVLIQYPLWLGQASWFRVWDLHRKINLQESQNQQLRARNQALDAEVEDLKKGLAAIEEYARRELDMIKHDEVFIQYESQAKK